MLSLLYDLSTDGYGRLIRDPVPLSMDDLRCSSGIVLETAILGGGGGCCGCGCGCGCECDLVECDADEVRLMRSLEDRSLVLLWRSLRSLRSLLWVRSVSLSLSLSLSLLVPTFNNVPCPPGEARREFSLVVLAHGRQLRGVYREIMLSLSRGRHLPNKAKVSTCSSILHLFKNLTSS